MKVGFGEEVATLGLPGRSAAPKGGGLSLVVFGEGIFSAHPLPSSGRVVIGRSEQADVRIEDGSISRRHAVLHLGPPLAIEDLGSANGTRLGDRKLVSGDVHRIATGEVVDLGSVMVVVQTATVHSGLACHGRDGSAPEALIS